jgi:hypothetical protein
MMGQRFLLDTGPLFDYLYCLGFAYLGDKVYGRLPHLNTEPKLNRFSQFLMANKPVLTVTGAICEVGGLFQRNHRKDDLFGVRGFWSHVWSVLFPNSDVVLSEVPVPLSSLGLEVVATVGPVDASLLWLARQLQAQDRTPCIITGDHEFYGVCNSKAFAVQAMWIDEILHASA